LARIIMIARSDQSVNMKIESDARMAEIRLFAESDN
jgi:hypothetical protein